MKYLCDRVAWRGDSFVQCRLVRGAHILPSLPEADGTPLQPPATHQRLISSNGSAQQPGARGQLALPGHSGGGGDGDRGRPSSGGSGPSMVMHSASATSQRSSLEVPSESAGAERTQGQRKSAESLSEGSEETRDYPPGGHGKGSSLGVRTDGVELMSVSRSLDSGVETSADTDRFMSDTDPTARMARAVRDEAGRSGGGDGGGDRTSLDGPLDKSKLREMASWLAPSAAGRDSAATSFSQQHAWNIIVLPKGRQLVPHICDTSYAIDGRVCGREDPPSIPSRDDIFRSDRRALFRHAELLFPRG